MVLFSAWGRRKRVLKMVVFSLAAVAVPALAEGRGLRQLSFLRKLMYLKLVASSDAS